MIRTGTSRAGVGDPATVARDFAGLQIYFPESRSFPLK